VEKHLTILAAEPLAGVLALQTQAAAAMVGHRQTLQQVKMVLLFCAIQTS
jgi:hypothetical protein